MTTCPFRLCDMHCENSPWVWQLSFVSCYSHISPRKDLEDKKGACWKWKWKWPRWMAELLLAYYLWCCVVSRLRGCHLMGEKCWDNRMISWCKQWGNVLPCLMVSSGVYQVYRALHRTFDQLAPATLNHDNHWCCIDADGIIHLITFCRCHQVHILYQVPYVVRIYLSFPHYENCLSHATPR